MSINRVVISGNLTRDGEIRATAGGTTVLTFGVAVNDRRRNASGEWEDVPNFVDCVMFGTRADALAAVTGNDTVNTVVARAARELFRVPRWLRGSTIR